MKGYGGLNKLLLSIQQAANNLPENFVPDEIIIAEMKPLARKYVNSLKSLVTAAKNAESWNFQQLTRFIDEINWAKHVSDIQVAYLDDKGSGNEPTCVTKCVNEYS